MRTSTKICAFFLTTGHWCSDFAGCTKVRCRTFVVTGEITRDDDSILADRAVARPDVGGGAEASPLQVTQNLTNKHRTGARDWLHVIGSTNSYIQYVRRAQPEWLRHVAVDFGLSVLGALDCYLKMMLWQRQPSWVAFRVVIVERDRWRRWRLHRLPWGRESPFSCEARLRVFRGCLCAL